MEAREFNYMCYISELSDRINNMNDTIDQHVSRVKTLEGNHFIRRETLMKF